jgi:hypothetical protein
MNLGKIPSADRRALKADSQRRKQQGLPPTPSERFSFHFCRWKEHSPRSAGKKAGFVEERKLDKILAPDG